MQVSLIISKNIFILIISTKQKPANLFPSLPLPPYFAFTKLSLNFYFTSHLLYSHFLFSFINFSPLYQNDPLRRIFKSLGLTENTVLAIMSPKCIVLSCLLKETVLVVDSLGRGKRGWKIFWMVRD